MYFQNINSALQIRQFYRNPAVKPSRTKQRRVERFRTVGSSQNDNALRTIKAVHLGQQLVQRLFPFVIAAHLSAVTLFADGVDFIDKDDTGSLFVGLFKQIPDFCRTHTHEHFYKFRTGNGEEGDIGFAGNSLCQKGFTSTRRAYQQRALRHGGADFLVAVGAMEKIYDFCQQFLGFLFAGNIAELDSCCGFNIDLGVAFSHAEHHGAFAAAHALCHFFAEEVEHQHHQCKRQDIADQNIQNRAGAAVDLRFKLCAGIIQPCD